MAASAMAGGFLLLSLPAGCSKQPGPPSVTAEESFPNSVGSRWVYVVYDSIGGLLDTVRVEIVGRVDIGYGERASCWRYSRSDGVWHRYVRTSGRRVFEYHHPNHAAVSTLYVFPLEAGDRWVSNPSWHDTSYVVMIDTVSYPPGMLERAVFVERRWHASGSEGCANTWFVPRIGIVRLDLWAVNSVDTIREFWELVDCKLETPPDTAGHESL